MARTQRQLKPGKTKSSTRFTVRVETHDTPTDRIIDDICRAMECCGFSRRVTTANGTQYLLPTLEYRISSHRSCLEIRDLARKVIGDAGHECAILVTQGPCRWHNLRASTDLN